MRLSLKTVLLSTSLAVTTASAQLSTNPDKFLGNITTSGRVNPTGFEYVNYWNQITCENETKWQSVEGNNNNFNWGGADNAYNYAKQHKFPFKFHTLVWGDQYPSWLESLTPEQRYKEIVQWMDAVKQHFPDLQLIDVVNEAITGHQAGTPYFIEALGGTGTTGYDWIVKAFELAHERWPNAILIYNDFNTFQWNTQQFIDLVKAVRDAGAPIDAYGCQSHDLTDCSLSTFKSSMDRLQNELKMPMYSTEYDIGAIGPTDDNKQLQRYKEQIPYMWERDYCAGITLWGWIYGSTWINLEDNNHNVLERGISGIIKDGVDRPAMTWLKEYMASDAAKNAKSPFPGMKKEASVYIRPQYYRCEVDNENTIHIDAKMRTKTIDHIDVYINNAKEATLTEAPYELKYTPTTTSKVSLKAVVTTTDGTTYERVGGFFVTGKRSPYNGVIELPGTIEAENFDAGGEGVGYHDSDTKDEGKVGYRSNNGGVDIVKGNGGYAIGYTAAGEWLEYSVDVKETGIYEFEAFASAGSENASFSICLADGGKLQTLAGPIAVPCITAGSWDTYSSIKGLLSPQLKEGRHIIRFVINGAQCNIDKVVFRRKEYDPRSAYNNQITELPGTLEAENFDHGGEGFTFHDNDGIDQGNHCYRTDNDGVDIVAANAGHAINNIADGEWLEYTVDVKQAGKYLTKTIYTSSTGGGTLTLSYWDDDELIELVTIENLKATEEGKYVTYRKSFDIPKTGQYVIRVTAVNGGFSLDRIEFSCTQPTGIDDITAQKAEKQGGWWTISGQRLNAAPAASGLYIHNGKKVIIK